MSKRTFTREQELIRLYALGVLCGMFMAFGILLNVWWGALVAIVVVAALTAKAYFVARAVVAPSPTEENKGFGSVEVPPEVAAPLIAEAKEALRRVSDNRP